MRTVLHSDLNNFYASVECQKNPDIRDKPVVVVGSKEDRHGVVLAKNLIAKSMGVKTGDVFWQAEQKCGKELVQVRADFPSYIAVSETVRKIYADYTQKIEPYGIDECWLDVTGLEKAFGGGREIAESIRERVKKETGLTVSVGVSWNKIFAKLGSDMKKPDAVTEITPENYRQKVWVLPVRELLYVGKSTGEKLNRMGINTIGDLAKTSERALTQALGKWGGYLYKYANGNDDDPVRDTADLPQAKSVGNSLTFYRDITSNADAEPVIWMLADTVASRVRAAGLGKARTVHLFARSSAFKNYGAQCKLESPSCTMRDIAKAAFSLLKKVYPWQDGIRCLGVSVSDFSHGDEQLSIFSGGEREEKLSRLDGAIDKIRKKYGNNAIKSATLYSDPKLRDMDIVGEKSSRGDGFGGSGG